MKICVGVHSKEDIYPLIKAGADEFFCGILPPKWREKYEAAFLNRRENYHANILDEASLSEIISLAHENNRSIYVTFNALYYPPTLYPEITDLISSVASLDPDGVIIADIGLLIELSQQKIDVPVVLSGEFGVSNSYTLKILQDFINIKRIIFQRHLTIVEMKSIIRNFPDYDYEAFVLNERCPFVGSSCFSSHSLIIGEYPRVFCTDLFDSKSHIITAENRDIDDLNRAYYNLCAYHKKETFNDIFMVKDTLFNEINNPVHCGLCYIKTLKNIGVGYVKVVGRGRYLALRVKLTRLAKKVIDNNFTKKEIEHLYNETFGTHFTNVCQNRDLCYY